MAGVLVLTKDLNKIITYMTQFNLRLSFKTDDYAKHFFTVLSLLRSLNCCLGPSSYGKINHNHNYSDEIKIVQRDCSLIWEKCEFFKL